MTVQQIISPHACLPDRGLTNLRVLDQTSRQGRWKSVTQSQTSVTVTIVWALSSAGRPPPPSTSS